MSDDEALERALATCLRAPDPVARRDALLEDAEMPDRVRRWLSAIDPDGLRLTRLLVAKLRFERLVAGSELLAAWAQRDPDAFVDAFARYHEAVPPTSADPVDEAALFAAFHALRNS